MAGRKSLTVFPGMFAINENAFINVKNTSFSIMADVDVPVQPANGVLVAQGGRFGGWALYVKDGKPVFHYNFLGLKQFNVISEKPLPAGKSTVKFDFAYDGGGPGKGGTGTLFISGVNVGQGASRSPNAAASPQRKAPTSASTPARPFRMNTKIRSPLPARSPKSPSTSSKTMSRRQQRRPSSKERLTAY